MDTQPRILVFGNSILTDIVEELLETQLGVQVKQLTVEMRLGRDDTPDCIVIIVEMNDKLGRYHELRDRCLELRPGTPIVIVTSEHREEMPEFQLPSVSRFDFEIAGDPMALGKEDQDTAFNRPPREKSLTKLFLDHVRRRLAGEPD